MERSIKIKTKDNHIIYGTLNIPTRKSNNLIIFVHGLASNQNSHIFYNGARFFSKQGFATFRFDLYSWLPKGRKISNCTISAHVRDLDQVTGHFAGAFDKIYLVGHSLGGVTVLSSDTSRARAIVLWDASCNLGKGLISVGKYYRYNKCLDKYVAKLGIEVIIGKAMYKEWQNFPTPKSIMPRVYAPVKIIVAEKGVLMEGGRAYFKYTDNPKEFTVIKGATHRFDEEGVEYKLFQETLKWFKKYS